MSCNSNDINITFVETYPVDSEVDCALTNVTLTEAQPINVTIGTTTELNITVSTVEPIDVAVYGFSILNIATDLENYLILEEPTKLTDKRFKTVYPFVSTRLVVWFNGLKEKYINVIDDNTFEFEIDLETDDIVEVQYIRKGT